MSHARYLIGDVREQLATIPDDSIDLVLTSPPFLALRSYLPADHPDKHMEIGSEPDPASFLQTLLALTAEWDRVLAPHGSIAVELGDTYSGSGGAGGDYGPDGMRGGQEKFTGSELRHRKNKVLNANGGRLQQGPGWPTEKSLCMIPQLYAASLAYGRNLLTGEPCERWRVRNIVRWCRPNPPVGALGDKFRPGTSEMTIACKSRTRYFDLDAVRTEFTGHEGESAGVKYADGPDVDLARRSSRPRLNTHAGAPPLDWWSIPTQPYSGSHYATFPEALCVKPIEAMVPRRVCTVCGEPSRRITEASADYAKHLGSSWADRDEGREKHAQRERNSHSGQPTNGHIASAERTTTGWSDCGHNSYRRGVVLDPFAGSGTTLKVATGLGRDAMGIDIDARNADLARERCGMFLEVASVESARVMVDVELPE